MSTPQPRCWALGPGPRCLSPMSSLLPFSHTVKAIRRTDSHSGVWQWIWQWISFTIIEGNSCCHICCNQRSHLMLFTLIVTDTASLLQANLQSGLSSLWVPVASSGSLHLSLPLLFFFHGKWLSGQIPFFQKEELSHQSIKHDYNADFSTLQVLLGPKGPVCWHSWQCTLAPASALLVFLSPCPLGPFRKLGRHRNKQAPRPISPESCLRNDWSSSGGGRAF